jgi:hypothetical protein
MSHPASNLQVIASRGHQERVWMARLRALPPGVFDLTLKRIAQGDPIRQVARYLHGVDPDVAEETFQKWLRVLAKQLRELLAEKKTVDEAVKIIKESSVTSDEGASSAGRPPVPSAGSSQRLKAIVNNVDKDLRSEMMFKFLWATEQRRLGKMLDLEEKLGVLLPNVPKEIDTLRSIAESLLTVEMGRWALMQGGYVPEMAPPEPGSLAEKVSKLDIVDRNLIRTAATHVIDMIHDEARKLQAEADLHAAGEKVKTAIPENDNQRSEIREKPSLQDNQYRENQETPSAPNNPPKRTADPFLIG